MRASRLAKPKCSTYLIDNRCQSSGQSGGVGWLYERPEARVARSEILREEQRLARPWIFLGSRRGGMNGMMGIVF